MKFKVGDRVIITKPFVEVFNINARITEIDDNFNCYKVEYQRGDVNEWNLNYYENCNIFFDSSTDKIELDKKYYRDLKLKELGI